MTFQTIALFAIVALIVFTISIYNSLIRARNYFKNAYAQINVQLTRRYDLIPNLVETAKAYMQHEKQTLTAVIEARNKAQEINVNVSTDPGDPAAMKQLMQAEEALTKSLGSFFALAENYPDLKANTTMTQLMEELTSTENKISFARQAFNDFVMAYNNKREVFPSNFIAHLFNFKPAEPLELENEQARNVVKVQF